MATKQNTIKTGIALTGEKEYREACKNINASLRETASEMKVVTAQFSDNASSTEALTAKGKVLGKQLEEQKKKVEAAETALKQMKESGLDPTDPAYKKMQTNLNNSKAELISTQKAIEKNSAATENNSGLVQDSGKEITSTKKAVEKNSAAVKANASEVKASSKVWSGIGKVVKKAGAVMSKTAAALGTAATAAATALTGMTVSAAHAADDLLTQAQNTHISAESLQKYRYALNFVDGDIDTLTKTIRKNIKSMDDARAGSKRAQEAYKKLGVSITDSSGQLRDGETVYWEVIDALGKIESQTDRDALALQLFGRSGTEVNTIIDAGSEAFKSYGKEAEEMGAVMSGPALSALGAFDDKLQVLREGLGGLKNAAAMIMLPFLDDLAEDGIPVLAEFTRGIQSTGGEVSKMAGVIGTGLSRIVNLIVSKLPEFVGLGVQMITTLISGIISNAPAIASAAVSIITTLTAGLSEMLPMLISGAAELISGLALGLSEALPTLIPTIVELMLQIVDTLLENIPLLLDAALQLVSGLADGVIAAIPILLERLPELIQALIDGLMLAIPQIMQTGFQLITALVGKLPEIISMILGAVPQIISSITQLLIENIPLIAQTGYELITALIDALPDIIMAIVDALPEIIDSIVSTLLSSLPVIIQTGFDLITALIGDLPGIVNTIVSAIPSIISGLVGAITDAIPDIIMAGVQLLVALVENIPEIIAGLVKAVPQIIKGLVDAIIGFVPKLAETGLNLIKGLWNGISDAAGWLWKKVKGFCNDLVGKIKGFLGIHSPSTIFADIGGNLAKGLPVGFGREMPKVKSTLRGQLSGMVEAVEDTTHRIADGLSRMADTGSETEMKRSLHFTKRNLTDISERVAEDYPDYKVTNSDSSASAELLDLLRKYLPQAASRKPMKVVLDTGALVGGIAEPLDEKYGEMLEKSERGVI